MDASNLQRQVIHGVSDLGRPKAESARDSIAEINPLVRVNHQERRPREPGPAVRAVRPHPRRHRQLRHPLPRQRRGGARAQAVRVEADLPVRGARRPCSGRTRPTVPDGERRGLNYRDLYPEACPAWCPRAPRKRRAGHPVRVHRRRHGHRGGQADHRHGRVAARPADDLRRPRDELPHHPHPQGPGVAGDHEPHRLRRVLRGGVRRGGAPPRAAPSRPRGLAELGTAGVDYELVDVREPVEWEIVHLDGATLIPKGAFESGEGLGRVSRTRSW